MRQPSKNVGRRRGNQQQVCFIRQPDVSWLPALLFIIEVGDHRVAGECFEGQRRDEAQRVGGHHDAQLATLLRQQAGEIGGAVGRNGTSDA